MLPLLHCLQGTQEIISAQPPLFKDGNQSPEEQGLPQGWPGSQLPSQRQDLGPGWEKQEGKCWQTWGKIPECNWAH